MLPRLCAVAYWRCYQPSECATAGEAPAVRGEQSEERNVIGEMHGATAIIISQICTQASRSRMVHRVRVPSGDYAHGVSLTL